MAVERKVPAIIDNHMSFCPGCGHGIIIRLICECLEDWDRIRISFSLSVLAAPPTWAAA